MAPDFPLSRLDLRSSHPLPKGERGKRKEWHIDERRQASFTLLRRIRGRGRPVGGRQRRILDRRRVAVRRRLVVAGARQPFARLLGLALPVPHAGVETVGRKQRRVIAALGPRVLELSAQRSAGAHPYLTTPEHTASAREILGPSAFLAPEHKAVLTTDAEVARTAGRKTLDIYLNLKNYVSNWKRLGFTDADVAKPGSDALVDAVVAYGTAEQIAQRLQQHLAAGADHVPVQVLTGRDKLVSALTELAGPLGLRA